MHPFGIRPTHGHVMSAIRTVQKAYQDLPETTCCSRGICCRAGCPNMRYAEYLNIRYSYIDTMDKESRLDLLMACVSNYIRKQDVTKPRACVFLTGDTKCAIYDARPFKCRAYGLIPNDLYRRIAIQVGKDLKVDPKTIPLCEQCPLVKIKDEFVKDFPHGTIPEATIREKETLLRENDCALGMPETLQEQGFAYLTYHDWHLITELGTAQMSKLSDLRPVDNDAAKEKFLETLKKAVVEAGKG